MGWIRQQITLNVYLDETKAASANWKLWLVAAEATVFLRCQDPGEKAPIATVSPKNGHGSRRPSKLALSRYSGYSQLQFLRDMAQFAKNVIFLQCELPKKQPFTSLHFFLHTNIPLA